MRIWHNSISFLLRRVSKESPNKWLSTKGDGAPEGLVNSTEVEDSTMVLSVAPLAAASSSPGAMLDIQVVWPLPDLPISNAAGEDQ